jgi:hypothetical protein
MIKGIIELYGIEMPDVIFEPVSLRQIIRVKLSQPMRV